MRAHKAHHVARFSVQIYKFDVTVHEATHDGVFNDAVHHPVVHVIDAAHVDENFFCVKLRELFENLLNPLKLIELNLTRKSQHRDIMNLCKLH